MSIFTYKSITGKPVNIEQYTITVNPGLQADTSLDILDKYVGVYLSRYTDGVLDNLDGYDSHYITVSTNITNSYTNDLIKCNHASTPIVLTILNDVDGGFFGTAAIAAYQAGTAAISFAAGAGVTLRGTLPTIAQYGTLGIMRVGANEWAYL